MKKIFTLAALAVFTIAANAQTETVLLQDVSMESQTEVASPNGTFKYATSEATSGKGEEGSSLEVTYNGVTYAAGLGYSQGSTNVMSWVVQPTVDGTLDIAIKMGGNKKTYVMEFDAAKYSEDAGEDLTIAGAFAVAGGTGLCSDFATGAADYITYPSIAGVGVAADADHTTRNLSGSWDGSTPINTIPDPEDASKYLNEYEVISISAKAGNIYIVGCAGSKLMTRGISFIEGGTAVAGIAEAKAEAKAPVKVITANGVQIGNYNVAGQQVK
ncbi:MAG: hypothetical protein J6P01_03930 [Prevotella sp.]|nr:hypothetical protein [Prevotella sp.]